MLLGNSIVIDESTTFRSLRKGEVTFNDVYADILEFIGGDLNCAYRISIGSDSQVSSKSVFVTCIHVHRIGKGAIGFLHKSEMQRPIRNLREKIYLETCTSLQLAYLFDDEKICRIKEMLGKNISFEFHIDVGTKGQTKALISEMVGMVKGLNFEPKIKPDSYCASCFADKYTKAM
ncbi:MAG: ribonuclease H-like YkuK family protein [Clostridia bacterium]|nr:ribonuclease H-like YkuK family protein [Clostridia bacterium]